MYVYCICTIERITKWRKAHTAALSYAYVLVMVKKSKSASYEFELVMDTARGTSGFSSVHVTSSFW